MASRRLQRSQVARAIRSDQIPFDEKYNTISQANQAYVPSWEGTYHA